MAHQRAHILGRGLFRAVEEKIERAAVGAMSIFATTSSTTVPPLNSPGQCISSDALRSEQRDLTRIALSEPGWWGDVLAENRRGVAGLLRSLAEESEGDLLWFRPDQWRLPVSEDIDPVVREWFTTLDALRATSPRGYGYISGTCPGAVCQGDQAA